MRRLNPVNQARWARFRHNRRGYWSLWIFAIIFALSLCAELIANDKPLAVHYQDRWYFPLIHNYSESDFGGPLATPADYQDPWLQQRLEDKGWVLWAPVRFSGTAISRRITPSLPRRRRKTGWAPTPTAAMCWSAFCMAHASPCCSG